MDLIDKEGLLRAIDNEKNADATVAKKTKIGELEPAE